MRVLAATIGALLITVSHAALAQDHHGEPQDDVAQAERQCASGTAAAPQSTMSLDGRGQGKTENLGAKSSERQMEEPADAQPSADQLQMERSTMRAEDLLARLPERPPAQQSGLEPSSMRAEDLLAGLPVRETAADPETQRPAEQAEDLLAQLPERQPAQQSGLEQSSVGAEDLLAGLPAREPAADQPEPQRQAGPAERLLAQLPERTAAGQPDGRPAALQAEQILTQLPSRPRLAASAAIEPDRPRLPQALRAGMQNDQLAKMVMPRDPGWRALREPDLGTTMDLPRAMFSIADGHAYKGQGRRYKTPDGGARVTVWKHHNTRRDTPAGYLRRTFSIPRASLDYERATPEFAVVSGAHGGWIYYLRCNLDPANGTLHCFDLAYPARDKAAWDGIVTRMSRSLKPLHD